jgi:hypothetical protein
MVATTIRPAICVKVDGAMQFLGIIDFAKFCPIEEALNIRAFRPHSNAIYSHCNRAVAGRRDEVTRAPVLR